MILTIFITLFHLNSVQAANPVQGNSCDLHPRNPFSSLLAIEETLEDCTLPAEGETRRAFRKNIQKLENANYLIKQIHSTNGHPAIEISVPVDYQNFGGSEQKEKMRTYVNGCLDWYKQYLVGPNGEQLTIRLADPADERHGILSGVFQSDKLKANKVKMQTHPGRQSADQYGLNTDCKTIFHETMHLLGLVDEYPEEETNFDCRAIGPVDSLMHSEVKAFSAVMGGCIAQKKAIVCDDPQHKISETEILDQIQRNQRYGILPKFSGCHFEDRPTGPFFDQPLNFNKQCGGLISDASEKKAGVTERALFFYEAKQPWRKSLLRSAQFNKIAYPQCKTLNQGYDDCAQNAYRAKDKSGKGCKVVAAQCSTPAWVGE